MEKRKNRKTYFNSNIQYLCASMNIELEELRLRLGISTLQFKAIGWPRTSEKISNFFGITREEFLYTDFTIKKSFRYLSHEDGRNAFCLKLINEISSGIDLWEITNFEIIEELYGTDVYKQVGFIRYNKDYNMVIIINTYKDNATEEEYGIFPDHGFAYGYLDFGTGYRRFFKSFEDLNFKELCQKILVLKNYTTDKWITKDFYKHEDMYFSFIDFEKINKQIEKRILHSVQMTLMFGENWDNNTIDEQLVLIGEALNWLNIPSDASGKTYLNNFNAYLKKSKKAPDLIKKELQSLAAYIEEELDYQKEKLIQKEKDEKFKMEIVEELRNSINQLGCWSKEDQVSFSEEINCLSQTEFCDQLKRINSLDNNELNSFLPELEKREIRVLKRFIIFKRFFVFKNYEPTIQLYDFHDFSKLHEEDKAIIFLTYYQMFQENSLSKYYGGLSSMLATALVYLYAKKNETIRKIFLLKSMHIKAGVNNLFLDNLYDDICAIHGKSIVDLKEYNSTFDCKKILELSNATWTDFFEITDDKVMENAISTVYKKVKDLFCQNNLELDNFFLGRTFFKKYKIFSEYNNEGLDVFAEMASLQVKYNFIGNIKKYRYEHNEVYIEGRFAEIELLDQNYLYRKYPLIDSYLATYICKYMEGKLRLIAKYKTKVSYKYGGYYLFDKFFSDQNVPNEIVEDYRILKKIIEDGSLRNCIYDAMDLYFTNNPDEFQIWEDRCI